MPVDSIANEILERLKGEFVTDTLERLDHLENVLEDNAVESMTDIEALAEIRREAHNIKGMGGSFGFPTVSVLGHRLEDYLADVTKIDERHVADCYRFFDALRSILEGGNDPGETISAGIIKQLPAKWSPAVGARPGLVEVLLAVDSRILRLAVERELFALGYRVVSAKTGLDILQLAIKQRPDVIIVSAVLEELWGLDAVRALLAMDATKDIAIGILTSFEDERLGGLPESVVIIREDAHGFAEGLAEIALRVKVGGGEAEDRVA